MARRRCDCPCPQHPQPAGTVLWRMVGVPDLRVQRAAEGFVVGRIADGKPEMYFKRYEGSGETVRLVDEPLPVDLPESWLPAVKRVEAFLGAVLV